MSAQKKLETGYVPKADATRGVDQADYPQEAQRLEADQTRKGACDEHAHDGGRYGDGW